MGRRIFYRNNSTKLAPNLMHFFFLCLFLFLVAPAIFNLVSEIVCFIAPLRQTQSLESYFLKKSCYEKQIVILKGYKWLLMDVLRRGCFLGKSFNLTEINTSFFAEIFGWLEKEKCKT